MTILLRRQAYDLEQPWEEGLVQPVAVSNRARLGVPQQQREEEDGKGQPGFAWSTEHSVAGDLCCSTRVADHGTRHEVAVLSGSESSNVTEEDSQSCGG